MIVRVVSEGPHQPIPDHHPDCVPRVLFVMPSWPPKVIVLESLTPGDKNSQTQNAVRSVPVVAVMCGE